MVDHLASALALHELGYNVVPVTVKHPVVKWKPYQTVRIPRAQVEKWFEAFPDAGVGVLTGRVSGVIVLDADTPEAVADIERRGMPETITVATAKGQHWYLRAPDSYDAKTCAGLLPDVDVRGEKGFAVCPPTLHESGARYRWITSPWDTEPAACPEWLEELLRRRADERAKPSGAQRRGESLPDSVAATLDDDPIFQPRPGWHGAAPGFHDLTAKVRGLLLHGDPREEYRHEEGPHQRARVFFAIVSECARAGLGLRATIDELARQFPGAGSGDGKGWYRIMANHDGWENANAAVARQYAKALDLDRMPRTLQAREELVQVRDQILRYPWTLRDATLLRVLLASLRIGWNAATITPQLPTRTVALYAVTDAKTVRTRLVRLVESGWLTVVEPAEESSNRVASYRLQLVNSNNQILDNHLQRIYGERLQHALHPAFHHGGGLNVVAWLALSDEPVSVAELAEQISADRRTVGSQLRALAGHGLAVEDRAGRWTAAGDGDVLDAVATENGGWDQRRTLAERHRDEREQDKAARKALREGATP